MFELEKNDVIAVVGASINEEKFGYKILKFLLDNDFKNIFPVNHKGGMILGMDVYKNLEEIKKKVDVVIFVVLPKVTFGVLNEVKNLGIEKVWMQPGSESNEAVKFCEDNGIDCVSGACMMNPNFGK